MHPRSKRFSYVAARTFDRDLFARIYSEQWLIHWNASVSINVVHAQFIGGPGLKFFPLVVLVTSRMCVCVCVCVCCSCVTYSRNCKRRPEVTVNLCPRKTSPRVSQSRSYKNFLYRTLSGTCEMEKYKNHGSPGFLNALLALSNAQLLFVQCTRSEAACNFFTFSPATWRSLRVKKLP